MGGARERNSLTKSFVADSLEMRDDESINPDELQRRAQQSLGDRLLRNPEVRTRSGLSRRQSRLGNFPAFVMRTSYARGWRESDIEAWLASREAAVLPSRVD
jgi:prophage regulatory protein